MKICILPSPTDPAYKGVKTYDHESDCIPRPGDHIVFGDDSWHRVVESVLINYTAGYTLVLTKRM